MSDKMEKWELQELVDEAVATGQIREEMINEYVYEFKQGGRVIQDLTAASYHQIALNKGITTKSIEREDHKTGVIYTVTVEMEGQERMGVSFEPYETKQGFDSFCFQKALTKATRNAIKQLVGATERFDTIAKLKALPMTVETPQEALPTTEAKVVDEAKPKTESELDILRKQCFAIWNKCEPEKGNDTLPANFWDMVRAKYGVKSRSTMTLKHWRDCLAWMSELRNEAVAAKVKPDVENDEIPI